MAKKCTEKCAARANLLFLLIRATQANLLFLLLDLLILMPFSLPSPFRITQFIFLFISISTRALLLALAKSI